MRVGRKAKRGSARLSRPGHRRNNLQAHTSILRHGGKNLRLTSKAHWLRVTALAVPLVVALLALGAAPAFAGTLNARAGRSPTRRPARPA